MRIRELREARRITGAELARCCRVSSATVTNWECGKIRPGSEKLPLIAAALACEVSDLYEQDEIKRASEEVLSRIHAKARADARALMEEGEECRA